MPVIKWSRIYIGSKQFETSGKTRRLITSTFKGSKISEATKTTDHKFIKDWIETRERRPSKILTGQKDSGILRVDFGEEEPEFQQLRWHEFFEIFDDDKLAFLHHDEAADGKLSRFNKFVERD